MMIGSLPRGEAADESWRPWDHDAGTTARAAETLLGCLRTLAKTQHNVVGEVLREGGLFVEWEHYPENDVYDPETRCQYYYHAHPPQERSFKEHGHFHLFMRGDAYSRTGRKAHGNSGGSDGLTHLIAISMDQFGTPRRLFTTNRWVTGERWLPASRVIPMVERFAIELVRPNLVVSRWMTAVVQLFRPTIRRLIHERDSLVEHWRREHPDVEAFEDRRLEITSMAEIDLMSRIREVTAHLNGAREK